MSLAVISLTVCGLVASHPERMQSLISRLNGLLQHIDRRQIRGSPPVESDTEGYYKILRQCRSSRPATPCVCCSPTSQLAFGICVLAALYHTPRDRHATQEARLLHLLHVVACTMHLRLGVHIPHQSYHTVGLEVVAQGVNH